MVSESKCTLRYYQYLVVFYVFNAIIMLCKLELVYLPEGKYWVYPRMVYITWGMYYQILFPRYTRIALAVKFVEIGQE